MKILKLEFKNLNSIKADNPVVIDFEKDIFSSAGLFVITGPTGSGKTTILDAITIALYRQVPRFNASHIKLGLADTVSRGASEAMARVTFSNENKKYEAFWSIRIKSKNGKLLKKPEETVRLKDLSSMQIIAEKTSEYLRKIEEITKLTYEQFLRSMMLAQGEFAAFLKANKKEKVDLLDRIIGDDIYKRIGEAIAARVKTEEDKLKEIKRKINEEDLLSQESKNELKNEKKETQSAIDAIKEKSKYYVTIINWYKKDDEINDKITKLENNKKTLVAALEKNKEILEALDINKKAEPFEKLLNKLVNIEKGIVAKEQKLAKSIPEIEKLKAKKEELQIKLDKARLSIEKAKNTQNEWITKLDAVTKIESDIKNLNEIIENSESEINNLAKSISSLKSELDKKINDKHKQQEALNQKIEYLEKNDSSPEIEKHFNDWALKLNQRKEKFELGNNITDEIKNSKKELERISSQIIEKQHILEKKKSELIALQQALKEAQKTLSTYNIEQLTDRQQQLADTKDKLAKALEISKKLAVDKMEKSKIKQDIIAYKLSVKELEAIINNLNDKIEVNSELLREIERTLQLENKVKSLEEERKKLKKAEPCPLCGSTEHPFVEKYSDFDFSETKKRLEAKKNDLEKLKNQLITNDKKLTEINAGIKNLSAGLEKITIEINNLEKDYTKLSIDIPYDELQSLENEYQNTVKELTTIQEKIKTANKLQQKYNKDLSQFQTEKDLYKDINNSISILKTKHDSMEKSIEEKQKEADKYFTAILSIEKKLREELGNFDLQLPEIKDTHKFIENIKKNTGLYNRYKEDKITIENNITVLSKEIENLQNTIAKSKKELAEKQDKKAIKEKDKEEKSRRRNSILPAGISVEQKRKELQHKLQKAEEHLNKINADFIKTDRKAEGIKAEKSAIEAELEDIKKEALALEQELNTKLISTDFADRNELERVLLDYETKSKYQDIKNTLDKKQTEIDTIEKEIDEQRKTHLDARKFEISREEADAKLKEIEKEQEKYQHRLGEISNIFAKDKELRQRNKQILAEMEEQQKVLDKWRTLFALTGGTKDAFNIYVQRLTLKSLINHANIHLSKLSKRYSLQLADIKTSDKPANRELNIELIDYYQTGSVRAVETCSGGESFLMSLSLALGLSDMASRNVKVESLFIDEGFGTLDDNLLETVISTLETLHGSGKIIGVISHVEKLKERISTQIQVEKTGNGVSTITLVSS